MNTLTKQISHMSPLKVAMAAQQIAPKMALVNAEPIAVLGMGCRLPGGVNNTDEYWQLLKEGRDAIVEVPAERWDINAYFDADPNAPGKMSVRHGGFLDNVDAFDAQFFGISPREAAVLDPQQRLLLEVSWQALENAGIVPSSLHNSNAGVYVGITTSEYEKLCLQSDIANQSDNTHIAYLGTGNDTCAAAGRLSYTLGLTGPSLSVNTACSSSLVSIHLACESLRQRTSNLAIAGGVNLTLIPDIYVVFSKAGMLSPKGRCRSFDASADGYVRGEGCGMVVLKRLSDAVAEGDEILGLIRGSAVNQDGRSSGLTVPNGPSQQAVIRQALNNSGVTPSQVGYVEAHGTGTSLGDPIEVGALGEVFREERQAPLLIGSAKSNIGHLESGAGVAGLIKTILALQHSEIPPNLHFDEPSPHIAWDKLSIEVVTKRTSWPLKRRIAGVSSFGYSGTNAHLVLEAAPELKKPVVEGTSVDRSMHLLTLSARTETALKAMANDYSRYLQHNNEVVLANMCACANTQRTRFAHRLAIAASSNEALQTQLTSFTKGERNHVMVGQKSKDPHKVAFLFTGQGSQYTGMGRELYETQPIFRQALDRCHVLLQPHLEYALLDVLYPEHSETSIPTGLINETAYTQPALFSLEYALATLWQSWGIEPDVMMGHSVGEYTAACMAGVFSLEDAICLISARGRLMQALPRDGSMMAIQANETLVTEAVRAYADTVSLATINGPESVVISGQTAAVVTIGEQFEAQGVKTRVLTVSHAFHSPLMDPMLADFDAVAKALDYRNPTIDIVSNVTGHLISDEMSQSDYWVRHVREAVRFNTGMATLQAQGCNVFLEIGPQPTLLGMARQCVQTNEQAHWIPSLRTNETDWQQMLESLGELFVNGLDIDWQAFDQEYQREAVKLPTYPFQRQRHWLPESALSTKRCGDALRPLVDKMIQSPLLKETILETEFSTQALPYLSDHTVFEDIVVPGASHLSVILSGADLMHMDGCQLEDVIFPAPLVLLENKSCTVQVVLTPEGDTQAFQLITTEAATTDAESITHATGYLREALSEAPADIDLAAMKARCRQEINPNSLYDTAAEQHIVFGPSFRWVVGLWTGEGEALAQLQRPDTIASLDGYWLHPGLLDACFQVCGVTLDESLSSETLLPFMLKRMKLYATAIGQSWWCHVKQVDEAVWDIRLFDSHGLVLADIDGFEMRAAPKKSILQRKLTDWLYDVEWKPQRLATTAIAQEEGRWLIFSDGHLGEELAIQLQAAGHATLLVHQGEQFRSSDTANCVAVNPRQPADFHRLIEENFIQLDTPCRGAVYLWSVEAIADEDTADAAQQLSLSALYLVQALRGAHLSPKLWLVTCGAQMVGGEVKLQMAQAALWGLGRTLSIEHPELMPVCLDLSPIVVGTASDEDATDQPITTLMAELGSNEIEDQIAWRAGERYVGRLSRYREQSQSTLSLPDGPFRVQLRDYGSADELQLAPIVRREPAGNEVEISVKSSALNFRDVLNSLGMLKQYYTEMLGIEHAEDVPLGFECAGTISQVGADVSHVQVGDAVVAATEGSFASFVTIEAALVARKPDNLSFEAAAGIPTAFLTAYYGLYELAKLKAGDRILIHSAAGGVGQAAVQLATAVGAEVYATASIGKWHILKTQGIKHVMNSRTLDFADEIRRLTDGQGVDVVLNSLNGDFIGKSFDVLAQGGRLLEIGKIGVWSQAQAIEYRPDVIYYSFDLGEETADDPSIITRMLNAIMADFEAGHLVPMPQTVFAINEVIDAYRYMQQTKHIGKVVLNFSPEHEQIIHENASYLITGGLGALGLQVAQSFADRGARHLILASRGGKTPEAARSTIQAMIERGITVTVARADVARAEDVARILSNIPDDEPLTGIIHAAGIIDDGMALQQTSERFVKVMAPKVQGTWNLHKQTQDIPLDFFVCFSSIASFIGSLGQTNYAAANAVVDVIMQQRRIQGLPGLSINWGPWANIGMAADLSFEDEGLGKIDPDAGIEILIELMQRPAHRRPAQVAIFPMNWAKFMRHFTPGEEPPFLSRMRGRTTGLANKAVDKSADILGKFHSATIDNRQNLLIIYVGEQLARVLDLDATQTVVATQRWNELGVDSLMTVELKNRIDRALHVTIPLETIMLEATTELIASMILERLESAGKQDLNSAPVKELVKSHEQALDEDVEMLKQIPQTYVNVEEQRNRQVLIDGEWRCDFASCNYLGMDLHPDVIACIPAALAKWGVHPSWTRAVASPNLYPELEKELADLVGAPTTLVFPSIHLLHIGVLPLLAGYNGVIIKDNAAHHSIYEACLRSQADGIEWVGFAHNDLADLEKKLARYPSDQTKIIAIDGVYSMSGEFPPLPGMVKLAKQYNALLYIDDAHGIGVIGENPTADMPYGFGGRGIVKYFGLDYEEDRILYVGGLSKAFSSYGCFITCFDEAMKSRLSLAGPFIFSGPSPVASLASALEGLRVNRHEGDQMREQVYKLTHQLVTAAQAMGYEVDNEHDFPIVGVVIGHVEQLTQACKLMWKHNILITPAIYPAVPMHRNLVRFSITASNTEAEIDQAISALQAVWNMIHEDELVQEV